MSTHSHAATSGECVLCGGPCREPFRLGPVHDNYPFMNRQAIEATKPEHGPPAPDQRTGKARARRKREDRMVRPETHKIEREDRGKAGK